MIHAFTDGVGYYEVEVQDGQALPEWTKALEPVSPKPKDETAEIKTRIASLESKITPRRLRESILTGDKTYLLEIESQIAQLREQLG